MDERIFRALKFASEKHERHRRKGGRDIPYINHPIAVATLLATVAEVTDPDLLAAALLHDTVEDTDATLEQIEHLFGKEIARLVDGVTKLSRIELQSDHTKHAENFRKLVLAMVKKMAANSSK